MPDLARPVAATKGNLQRSGGGTDDICFGCCPVLARISVLSTHSFHMS